MPLLHSPSSILSSLYTAIRIWKLLQLGWNETEAGEPFELERPAVSEITTNISSHISGIQEQYDLNKKTSNEIRDFHGVDKNGFTT